jgi:mannose/fructose/N-acetylgalactosamine-specific phosphotransferase system component IIC
MNALTMTWVLIISMGILGAFLCYMDYKNHKRGDVGGEK